MEKPPPEMSEKVVEEKRNSGELTPLEKFKNLAERLVQIDVEQVRAIEPKNQKLKNLDEQN